MSAVGALRKLSIFLIEVCSAPQADLGATTSRVPHPTHS